MCQGEQDVRGRRGYPERGNSLSGQSPPCHYASWRRHRWRSLHFQALVHSRCLINVLDEWISYQTQTVTVRHPTTTTTKSWDEAPLPKWWFLATTHSWAINVWVMSKKRALDAVWGNWMSCEGWGCKEGPIKICRVFSKKAWVINISFLCALLFFFTHPSSLFILVY